MRVLLVDSREGGDYSLDLVWAGLVRRFGAGDVFDWPPHEKHRADVPAWSSTDVEASYGAERRSLCYTSAYVGRRRWSLQEVRELVRIGSFDLVFVDERDETYLRYLELGLHHFFVPTVVVAGHDKFWNESPAVVAGRYPNLRAMFIDDWRQEYDAFPYAHLINLSTNFDHLWDPSRRRGLLRSKVYDICFMGYNSTPDRARLVDHILRRHGHMNNHVMLERRPDEMGSFVSRREYFETIAMSKICVNMPGASTCGRALRYYEIPYVGSCMLSQTFPARLLHPFEDRRHCLYFSTLEQFDWAVDALYWDPELRERLAAAGHRHAVEHHTVDARMDHIMGVVDG